MSRIKNKNYREFLDKGTITPVTENHIKLAFENIKGKHRLSNRAYLITQYYTGARPGELLVMKAKSMSIAGSYLVVFVPGSKGGLPREIRLRLKLELVKELADYVKHCHPEQLLFGHLVGEYKTIKLNKKGNEKVYFDRSAKLRYFFKKWFKGVFDEGLSPYFLRHSRMSNLSFAGISAEGLRQFKGSRTYGSVLPYLHMSKEKSEQIARKNK